MSVYYGSIQHQHVCDFYATPDLFLQRAARPRCRALPSTSSIAKAPLHGVEQNSVLPRGYPQQVCCTLRPICGSRQQRHWLFNATCGFTHCTLQRVCCAQRHTFPRNIFLYLKYLRSFHGFLHALAQRGCKWDLPQDGLGLGFAGRVLWGAEVLVPFVQLLGTQALCSCARALPCARLATAPTFVLPFDICDF